MPYLKPVELKSFLLGQYFADGVKITLGVLLPSLVFSYWNHFETGLILSLGAFLVSISDSTGPMSHRRTGMLFACLLVFVSALVTGFLNAHRVLLGIQIPVFCFVFAMLTVYGNRAASVGTAALLAMAISIDQHKTSGDIWGYALGILGGGAWYTLLSLSLMQIRPYRVAQQALGECVLQVAQYLRLKGDFYQPNVDVGENYRNLSKLQVRVNEHQDNVRDMLFKTRIRVGDSIRSGRLLIMVFTDIMDMFEQMMSAHYDYDELRKQYGKYGVLQAFDRAIHQVAGELSRVGYALINNERPRRKLHIEPALETIRKTMDEMDRQGVPVMMLRKIYVNLKTLCDRLDTIFNYFQEEKVAFLPKDRVESLTRFVSRQEFDLRVVKNHLSIHSTFFRHALRLAITCLAGYLIALQLPFGQHSYWVVLTIVVILRPGFSLTKRRNYERIMGTVAGGLTGVLVLLTVDDYRIRFAFLVVFMVLAYSFWRIRYGLSVLFMTPFIFILYGFIYPDADMLIAQERIVDTVVGSVLAFLASNFLFPSWEYGALRTHMVGVLRANLDYLKQITDKFAPDQFDETAYRLARRKLYLQTANLSGAFQRMLDEPKRKQRQPQTLHQFVVLNHMLSSYLATLSTSLLRSEASITHPKQVRLIKKSRQHLLKAIECLAGQKEQLLFPALKGLEEKVEPVEGEDLLTQQLRLIRQTCADIEKLSGEV